jgi:hypothetical protein
MITENLSTLKIHKLTQSQYDREVEAGNIEENALYLTPDEPIDLSLYATVQYVSDIYETKADATEKSNNIQTQLDDKFDNKTADELRTYINAVGYNVEKGTTWQIDDDSSVIAGVGAEIFNSYIGESDEYNIATGDYSHAEGSNTKSTGYCSHAEGYNTKSTSYCSHAEGNNTKATGYYSHAEGYNTSANGNYSHAEGCDTSATGFYSHAEGNNTKATGDYSHAEGRNTETYDDCSHAEGYNTKANGYCSHAEGYNTSANGGYSHAEGRDTSANGTSSHAEGYNTIANSYQHTSGKYNKEFAAPPSADTQDTDNADAIFVIGYGTSTTRANAFRVSSGGKCRGASSFTGSGADFAELFEWADGNINNEDRRGLFVTLDGEKIKLANADDDYIGVISGAQAFVGNTSSEEWHGKYLTDVFGTRLSQEVEIPEKIDEITGKIITPAHKTTQYIVNPDYNPNESYIMRENRKEWGTVGLLGQVVVVDDGTCVTGGYVKPLINGVGTNSNSGYRVMKRIDENHIKVLVK